MKTSGGIRRRVTRAVALRRGASIIRMRLNGPGHAYQQEYSPHLHILFDPDRT
ncbi:hypothetical protein [Paraburkholderia bryophila]